MFAEPPPNLGGALFGSADDGECGQHRIGDQRRHLGVATSLRQGIEFRLDLAPPFDVEHRTVCGRRTVEREQGSDASGGRGRLILAAADADDDLRDDREFVSGAAGFAKTA